MEYVRKLAVVHREFESGLTENGAQIVDGKVKIICKEIRITFTLIHI